MGNIPGNEHFISFEGGEGGGKSTQVKLFYDWLISQGIATIQTRETYCPELRSALWEGDAREWGSTAEAMILMADRIQHQQEVILPNLTAGKVVISDRYVDSTRVYQSLVRGMAQSTFDTLVDIAVKVMPHTTFLLNLSAEVGLARKAGEANLTEDRFEQMGLDFHRKVNQGFRDLAVANLERFVVIDATQSMEKVQAAIQAAFKERHPELFT